MIEQEPFCYINPLTDFGFKKLFFNELNKELLIDFLNEILPEPDKIVDLNYEPTALQGEEAADRKAIFDIFCTNANGEYFIVEIQRAKQPYFRDRSLYYASFPIQKQAPTGKWDFHLKAVYFIGVLDFVLFNEVPDDHEHYLEYVQLIRQRTGTVYSKKINFAFVELPKFKKTVNELRTNADRWLFCLRNLSRLDSRPAEVQGRIFEKLFKVAEIKRLSKEDMETYRKSILEYDDVRSAVDYAREEGREEEKRILAKNCLKDSLSLESISRITGLSEKEIRKLQKEID